MIYPLKEWLALKTGYAFSVPTFYNNFHLGIDKICPIGTPIFAPVDGNLTKMQGTEGGLMAYLKGKDGKLWRFLHLSHINDVNSVKEGEQIGLTGNSGKSTSPHLHLDISKDYNLKLNDPSHFIDPELYLKKNIMNYDNKIVRNISTGAFALVIRGKKYVFSQNLDVLAVLTFMQVANIDGDKIVNVSKEEFDKIPLSNGLKF